MSSYRTCTCMFIHMGVFHARMIIFEITGRGKVMQSTCTNTEGSEENPWNPRVHILSMKYCMYMNIQVHVWQAYVASLSLSCLAILPCSLTSSNSWSAFVSDWRRSVFSISSLRWKSWPNTCTSHKKKSLMSGGLCLLSRMQAAHTCTCSWFGLTNVWSWLLLFIDVRATCTFICTCT